MFKNVDVNSATYLETIFKHQEWDSNPSCMVVELDNNLTCFEDTTHRTISYHSVLLASYRYPSVYYFNIIHTYNLVFESNVSSNIYKNGPNKGQD
jgi:hypothetical protein